MPPKSSLRSTLIVQLQAEPAPTPSYAMIASLTRPTTAILPMKFVSGRCRSLSSITKDYRLPDADGIGGIHALKQ